MKNDDFIKIVEITEEYIKFSNGYKLIYKHQQDCCENVYADFEYAKQYNTLGHFKDKTIFDVEFEVDFYVNDGIKLVKGLGFVIFSIERYGGSYMTGAPIFIPCYNEQNGYYSTNLMLRLIDGESGVILWEEDIEECEIDKIY